MKQQSLVVRSVSVCFLMILFLASCKKVNEATELGGDLIPPVDNVNTFDTTLEVLTYNHRFTTEDSSRSRPTDIHFIGQINGDPIFGKSKGTLFLQLKPAMYRTPFAFTSKDSLVALDSAVLVLSYRTVYGDSTIPQQFRVFEMGQENNFTADSIYLLHSNSFIYNNAISPVQSLLPTALNDSIRTFREAAINQVRLRLDNSFGNRLLAYDSTNAYQNDSTFNAHFKGLAVVPQGSGSGNALIGVSVADTNTKIALYYRYIKNGKQDTAITYFRPNSESANANYIERDYSGSELAGVAGDNTEDQLVYIQGTPGTFARIKIPALPALNNRIVHRAELIMEQVPDPMANYFGLPNYLYLDAFDSADSKSFRSIPYDVILSDPSFTGVAQPNYGSFGMIPQRGTGPSGNPISIWRFDLSRYVQRVVNKTQTAYDLRLSAPFSFYTFNYVGSSTELKAVRVNPNYAIGRVRLGGGNHPTQRMRLRIIYSKL